MADGGEGAHSRFDGDALVRDVLDTAAKVRVAARMACALFVAGCCALFVVGGWVGWPR